MATLEGGVWTLASNGNLIYKIGSVTAATIAGLDNLKSEDGKVYYVDPDTEETTEITGDNGEEIAVTTEEDATSSTITVDSKILGMKNVTLSLGKGYSAKLVIDPEALVKIAADETDENKSSETLIYTASNGTAVVKANLTAGFLVNSSGTIALYRVATTNPVNVASISGLRKGVAAEYATETAVLTASKDSGEGTITLGKNDTDATKSVLGTTAIAVTNAAIATVNKVSYYLENKYYLALDESKAGTYGYEQKTVADYAKEAYWSYSGTTASYKIDVPIGYQTTNAKDEIVKTEGEDTTVYKSDGTTVVPDGDTTITKIKVTAAKPTTLVTVTGLAKDLDISADKKSIGTYEYATSESDDAVDDDAAEPAFEAGLTVNIESYPVYGTNAKGQTIISTPGNVTVNINKNVLNNAMVALSSSVAKGNLATDNSILTAESTATTAPQELNIWVINGSTATYKRVQRAYYKKNAEDTKLTYFAQKDVMTYLTISGLSAEALDSAKKTYAEDAYEPKVITAIDGLNSSVTGDDLFALYEPKSGKYVPKSGSEVSTITIDSTLLDNKKVSIGTSNNFKIQLTNTNAPTFSDTEWNLDGTKAVLKGDIAEGWIVTQNGKAVNYTKAGDNQTLATITGLKKGTKLVVGDSDARTVGFGNDTSFKQGLSLATNDGLSSNNPVDFSTSTVPGANANYNRQSIIVSKNVIDTLKVQITSNFFDLELAGDGAVGGAVPTDSIPGNYWTLGTTATYKNNFGPYYELANNQLSITYKNPANNTNKPTVLTTIKGLDANVTEDDLTVTDDNVVKVNPNALDQKNVTITNPKDGTDYKLALDGDVEPTINSSNWEQASNGAVTYVANVSGGYKTNSTSSAIVYTPTGEETTLFTITGLRNGLAKDAVNGSYSGVSLNEDDNTVKLSYSALNNANVALKSSYGYDLVLDSDIPNNLWVASGGTAPTDSIAAWVIDGTTATYKAVIPAYYVYDADKDTLTYKKAADKKVGNKVPTYAKISGLSKGLMLNSDGDKIGYYNEDGAFVEGIIFDGTDIIIKDKGVLSTVDVKLDNTAIEGGYSIKFAGDLAESIMPQFNSESAPTWTVKNKTAYLIGGVSDGYVLSEDGHSIKYYKGAESTATIATISNLAANVTSEIANTAGTGFVVSGDSITAGANVLGNTKLSLKTNIPIDQQNYIFTLGDGVQTYEEAVDTSDKIWTINSKTSTATYRGSIESPYYALDANSTAISYTAAGLPDDLQFAKLEGLTNLVTIQGGELKGVDTIQGETEGTPNGEYTFKLSGGVLKAGTSVKLTDMNENDTLTFALSIAADVDTPEATAAFVPGGTNGELLIYKGTTAGYSLSSADTSTLHYVDATKDNENKLADIIGFTDTFKSNGATTTKGKIYDTIDGIEVAETSSAITVSSSVLTNKNVEFATTDGNKGNYTFALADDVTVSNSGLGWGASSTAGEFILYSNTSNAGHSLASDSKKILNVTGGNPGSTAVATISGIKGTVNSTTYQIAGISFNGNQITLSKGVLNGKDVTLTGGDYTLALNDTDPDDAGYVASSTTTSIWAFNNGTATYEEKTTEGYDVDATDSKTIKYSKAQTITTKIDNLSKEYVEVSEEGISGNKLIFTGGETSGITGETGEGEGGEGNTGETENTETEVTEAITFDGSKFTINDADVLAHKTSSLTISTTKGATKPDYTLNLATGIAATKENAIWSKTNKETTAKLTQKTKAGYSLQADGKKVIYSSDPTVATLATVSNLKKDVALNESGQIADTATAGLSVTADGVITIAKGVLDTGTAQLGSNDQYKFALAEDVPKENTTGTADVWSTASADKGKTTTATLKKVKPAFYSLDADDKKVKYNSAGDGDPTFTITGLKSGVKANPDGSLEGIKIDGDNAIKLDSTVLGTSTVTLNKTNANSMYRLALGDGVLNHNNTDTGNNWKDQSEWIASGTTYTYKTYDKASYGIDTDENSSTVGSIKYYAATTGTTHATIKGLKSGITNIEALYIATEGATSPTVGGTLKLTSVQLNNAKVTLTNSGDTKIKLALDASDEDLVVSETKPGSWTTNKTKATLSGTITAGYALSEDEKTITYNKTKTTKTLATVNGIVSGAKIEDTDYDKNTGVISLGKNHLGTSNVTVSGDGYTLQLADETLKSTTDDAKWIKTEGSTKATFTERTYNGFMVEDSGKTLKYYKNTTDVNHITITGLKSDLTPTDVEEPEEGQSPNKIEGVVVDTEKKTITLSADALAKSNVTLATKKGEYSDYSLELAADDAIKLAVKGGTEEADKITYQTFSNGTASLLKGKTEGWTRTSATKITYTPPSTTTLAKITGLPKTLTFNEDLKTPANNKIEGITIDGTTIKLDKRALGSLGNGKSVTLSTSGDYKLALDTANDSDNKVAERGETDKGKPVLTLSGTTAYLKAVTTGGYTLGAYNTSKKTQTITYYADKTGATLATITGLPKGCKLVDGKIYLSNGTTELLSYTGTGPSDKQVTVSNYYLTNNTDAVNLKITGGTFYNYNPSAYSPSNNSATFSKGTMIYMQNYTAGWSVTGSGDSITGYQYKTAGSTNIATVSGLDTSVSVLGSDKLIYDTDGDLPEKTFKVGQKALTTKNVTITMPKNATADDFYQFTFFDDVYTTRQHEDVWKDQVEWVASGGKAVYKLYDKTHYELVKATSGNGKNKNTTIKYIGPNAGTQYATISGLTKVASIGNSDIGETGAVSLTADDLGTSTVTLKLANADKIATSVEGAKTSVEAAKNFTLDFASDVVESSIKSAVWETTGTTAKLVGTVTKGYILSTDKKSVTYQSKNQDGKVIAQITNLRNGAEIKATDVAVDADDKRISHVRLDAYDLGTKDVALTGAGYALSLGSDVINYADTDAWSLQSDWVASNGTFTYKEGYNKASWKKVSDTSVKYYAASGGTNRVAITGLNKDIITADVDSAIAGADNAGAIVSIGAGNVITLGDEALNRANIAMSTNLDGYTFENVKDDIRSKASDLTGTVSGTTVTVKATQSQGYLLTNNSQGFTYYANATTPNIAVISGLVSEDYAASLKGNGATANLDFDPETNTFTLNKDQLKADKVGVSGTARFSFAEGYDNATINGSAGVDNISVAGSGLSINAGNGNDYIDLGSSGGNTFLYANGQGADVIANFGANDTIKVISYTAANKKISFMDDNSGDAIVKVNTTNNAIRIKNGASMTFSIYDKNGEVAATHKATSGNGDVLADDNFATTPQLSSIVKGSSGYMVTDDLTADATSLTKTDTTIAYSGDKK